MKSILQVSCSRDPAPGVALPLQCPPKRNTESPSLSRGQSARQNLAPLYISKVFVRFPSLTDRTEALTLWKYLVESRIQPETQKWQIAKKWIQSTWNSKRKKSTSELKTGTSMNGKLHLHGEDTRGHWARDPHLSVGRAEQREAWQVRSCPQCTQCGFYHGLWWSQAFTIPCASLTVKSLGLFMWQTYKVPSHYAKGRLEQGPIKINITQQLPWGAPFLQLLATVIKCGGWLTDLTLPTTNKRLLELDKCLWSVFFTICSS